MHEPIYERLKAIAKAKELTTYSEIAPLAGLDMSQPPDRKKIGGILDEISTFEHGEGRPLLSAVVVHKRGDRMPGPGFFTLAKKWGLYQTGGERPFFDKERSRVHNYWQREE